MSLLKGVGLWSSGPNLLANPTLPPYPTQPTYTPVSHSKQNFCNRNGLRNQTYTASFYLSTCACRSHRCRHGLKNWRVGCACAALQYSHPELCQVRQVCMPPKLNAKASGKAASRKKGDIVEVHPDNPLFRLKCPRHTDAAALLRFLLLSVQSESTAERDSEKRKDMTRQR